MLSRRLVRILLLLGATCAVVVATVGVLVAIDPKPLIEWYVAHSFDRRLAFGDLKVGWGNPLTIEARNVRLANPPWARDADMLRIDYLSADIDSDALWHGLLKFDRLRMEKPVLVLEAGEGTARNWHIPGAGGASGDGGIALVPKNRTQFPVLIDLSVRNGEILFRRPQRADIRIDFYAMALRTPAADQPMRLSVDGAYNGAPVRMNVDSDSVMRLRDRAAAFVATVSMSAVPGSVRFNGTLAEPLDFDGVTGTLQVDAQNLGDLLKIFDASVAAAFPLRLAGPFAKHGERWQITDGTGNVAGSDFGGAVALTEGGRGEADDIVTTLAFDRLYLQPLLSKSRDAGKPKGPQAIDLRPDDHPGAVFDAKVTAKQLVYGAGELPEFIVQARTRPGSFKISKLGFRYADGWVESSGVSELQPNGNVRLTTDVALAGLDSDRLVQLLGGPPGQLAGRLNGRASVEANGQNAQDALADSHGEAVLSMVQGKVSRDLVEKASTDLRTLFRKGEGTARVSCLVGLIDVQNGRLTLAPVRLRTPDTTIVAAGTADLVSDRLDLTLRAASGGPSIFALKAPIRITGTFEKADAKPEILNQKPVVEPHLDPAKLSPKLRQVVDGNPCLR